MFCARWLILVLTGVAFAATARAQTTQPAPDEWGQFVGTIATGLIGDSTDSSLDTIIPVDVPIRRFGNSELEPRARVRQLTDGLVTLASRAYSWPAETVAADLGTDMRANDAVPETMRRKYSPRDDADAKRANAVAKQWVSAVLHPSAGQLIGVIVVWEQPPPINTRLLLGAAALSEVKLPYFILVKGMKTEDGTFHVTQVAYGDANQALN